MFKAIFPAYIICFGLYILFSRQPDFFDGEFATGTIIQLQNKETKQTAEYKDNKKVYKIEVYDIFHNYKVNQKVKIIYEKSQPEMGTIYTFWGYWLSIGELIASILIPISFWFIAHSITKNPTQESIIEEMEGNKRVKKTKYEI